MRIHVWGTDFRRGSADVRRRLYLEPEKRESVLKELLNHGFSDIVYLATCNRIEFYTTAKDPFCDTRSLWTALLQQFGLGADCFYEGYHLEGKAALRHLMRVASSLESLVVGEPQILGQLKDALGYSKKIGIPVDASLERSFQLAFETAKRVRTETTICEKPVSVATLGLRYLQSHEGELPVERAVVVGRSPISVLVVQWLLKNRPQCPIVWVNRNPELLRSIPEASQVQIASLKSFLLDPPQFSHLFTATSSPHPLFNESFFQSLPREKRLVFDFAEPADIGTLPSDSGVRVIKLEDLKEEALQNTKSRATGVLQAEGIIEDQLKNYFLQQKEAPLLKDFNEVEPSFYSGLAEALIAVQKELPPETHTKVKRWAEALVKRNLHLSREHLRSVLRKVTDPTPQEADSEDVKYARSRIRVL